MGRPGFERTQRADPMSSLNGPHWKLAMRHPLDASPLQLSVYHWMTSAVPEGHSVSRTRPPVARPLRHRLNPAPTCNL
jgi:hypothetical protein